MITQRTFLCGLTLGTVLAPLAIEGQQPTMPVVGFVRTSSIESVPHMVAAFRQGLKDMGYVEGQNVAIEFRSADDHYVRLPAIIAELIRRPVAVVVANSAAAPRPPLRRSPSSSPPVAMPLGKTWSPASIDRAGTSPG
jgi:ABC-type uncharacterized transport system substrate-binding protein